MQPSQKSKLLAQLQKETKSGPKVIIEEDRIEDTYQILSKIQSKNLMLVQLLSFLIEKGFVRNEHPLHYFVDVYDSVKGTVVEQAPATGKGKQEEEQKFSRKKFVKVFKIIAKKLHPCDPYAFQNIVYRQMISNEHHEDVRIKLDDNLKKILTRQTIELLKAYQKEMMALFEMYLPENFNGKLGFSWQEIKYLEKKLPIIAVFRFLWDCQVCPLYITPTHFFELTCKIIPPHSILVGSGQKQGLFYSPENIISYSKESVSQKKMKLLDGDIGLSFFEFQMLLVRLSMDITKQKNDFTKAFQNFVALIKLPETIANKGETKCKPTKFEQTVKSYFQQTKKSKNNFQVQKRETKKKIQQILQINQKVHEDSRNQFKESNITTVELQTIKKSLQDDHLPQIPEKPVVEKQNQCSYNIEQKNIIIGQQLPKLPEKNKPVGAPKKADKKDELINKFKPEEAATPKISTDYYKDIIKAPTKLRINTEFPIILMETVYPKDIPNIYLPQKAELHLQTAYIHLSEHSYQKSFQSYQKSRALCQSTKNQSLQFFFLLLEAQIYEAAARDEMALLLYHKAKQFVNAMQTKQPTLKYLVYKGLGGCLYHVEEYQLALRCFLKARELKIGAMEIQSMENAILENNIGCVYMILNRNTEAMKCFALSQRIMDLKVGKFDQRTIVVQQNQNKNKKAFIEMVPAFKTMWKTYEQKPNLKPAVKTGSKKK